MSSSARTVERLVPLAELAGTDAASASPPRGASRAFQRPERPELVARGVGEMLDVAWNVLASRFAACVGVAFALALPAQVAILAIRHSGLSSTTREASTIVVPLLLQLLTAVLLANFVRDRLAGREGSVVASVRAVLGRFGSLAGFLIALSIVQGVTMTFVLCCCMPVAFLVQWQLSVVPAVYAIERTGLLAAIVRGMRLVRGWGNLMRWLGWYAVQTVMLLGLDGVTSAVNEPEVRGVVLRAIPLDGLAFDLFSAIPMALLMAVSAAYPGVLMTVYYFDTRVRAEGYDLAVKLEHLRGAEAAA